MEAKTIIRVVVVDQVEAISATRPDRVFACSLWRLIGLSLEAAALGLTTGLENNIFFAMQLELTFTRLPNSTNQNFI